MNLLARGWRHLNEQGPKHLLHETLYRLTNSVCERFFAVDTCGRIPLSQVGISHDEWHEYAPMGYWAIFSALLKIPLPIGEMSILDLGCGKGRVLILATALGCKRAIGVDIVSAFSRIAHGNLIRMRARRTEAAIYEHDAATFRVPDDVNVIYLANPFSGATLDAVLENIRVSHFRCPRALFVLCFNTRIFEAQSKHLPWLRKIRSAHYYPDFSCGIYCVGG